MTSTYTVRKQLTSRLNAFKRCIENNEANIEAQQAEITEFHEKVDVIEKALAILGAAWTPKKVARKLIIKKKVAKKVAKAPRKPKPQPLPTDRCERVKSGEKEIRGKKGWHARSLHFALAFDAHSITPTIKLIEAYEETARDNPNTRVSSVQLFQALNARLIKKATRQAVNAKFSGLRHSRHPELSTLFTTDGHKGGTPDAHFITLNPEAAANFKKLVKKMA